MTKNSKIQWTDHTFNPWIGCTKVSPGCANCYAEVSTRARVLRSRGHETWGKGAKRSRTSAANWKLPVRWNREAVDFAQCDCCGWRGVSDGLTPCPNEGCEDALFSAVRPRVFCASLSDWLDEEVPIEWLADLLKLIHDTPNLDWLLLTKRPQNWKRRISSAIIQMPAQYRGLAADWRDGKKSPHNVWIMATVENRPMADKRIPELLKIPAVVRGLSVEPMLEWIRFDPHHFGAGGRTGDNYQQPQIHWVIFGGESGPGARPCNIEWIRDGVRQCREAGVAPFVKQLGASLVANYYEQDDHFRDRIADRRIDLIGWTDENDGQPPTNTKVRFKLADKKGGDMSEWSEDLRVREFPEVSR